MAPNLAEYHYSKQFSLKKAVSKIIMGNYLRQKGIDINAYENLGELMKAFGLIGSML